MSFTDALWVKTRRTGRSPALFLTKKTRSPWKETTTKNLFAALSQESIDRSMVIRRQTYSLR
jgi:hypothetical protein